MQLQLSESVSRADDREVELETLREESFTLSLALALALTLALALAPEPELNGELAWRSVRRCRSQSQGRRRWWNT